MKHFAGRVLHVHKLTNDQLAALKAGDPQYVYIGGAAPILGLKKSKWANPHAIATICKKIKCGWREAQALANQYFRQELLANKKLLAALSELRGKTLICSCHPEFCHGHILLELAEQ